MKKSKIGVVEELSIDEQVERFVHNVLDIKYIDSLINELKLEV
jgi:hypothetical protein